MKQSFNHYKFKTLIILARLGLTFPLHYSIWSNLCLVIAFMCALVGLDDYPAEGQTEIAIVVGVISLCIAGDEFKDLHDKMTIKD